MKTLIVALLAFTLPCVSFAAPKMCLPIYISNVGLIQGLLKSDAYKNVNVANELGLDTPSMQDVGSIELDRTGLAATVRVTFLLQQEGATTSHLVSFKVEQTCEGTVQSDRL